ncbi:SUKH-4 family immunity protein [Actinomadura graeca]|uniref:SUKH-4 family immunity protein n=1 Tax=Actinomadura graeca TaxID=2750812 RepID=A0ABX8QZB6_9ACTN|nr:SUKH-4 family immunity protein [Actinomadura graeca]QXJ24149.1 SUKH-4 family immunity protein [Actinomadura graeca]
MPSAAEYLDAWGRDNTVTYPRQQWMEVLPAPARAYPDVGFLPVDLSDVFTAFIEGEVQLYDEVRVREPGGGPLRLLLIGVVPGDPAAWYLFDTETGRVVMLDTRERAMKAVNAALAHFIGFLYEFARFVDADPGRRGRGKRAERLRERFMEIDPAAFTDPGAWWPSVLLRLGAKE